MMWLHADLLLRVLVGTVLGAVIGYERGVHRRRWTPRASRPRW
jgi:uncharacterized membrane protein YhiD involved in acid resistance